MAVVREFRSLIFAKYDSESDFAKALGWPRQRLNKITNGLKMPDLHEVDEMAKELNEPPDKITQIFLRQ